MSDKTIIICAVLTAVALTAVLFIRRAVRYRRVMAPNEIPPVMEFLKEADLENARFQNRYILSPLKPFRTTKTVRIRQDHYRKISKIVRCMGQGELSIVQYVDKVLEHHLSDSRDSIDHLFIDNDPRL